MALLARRWMGPEVGTSAGNSVTEQSVSSASRASGLEEGTDCKKKNKRTKERSVTAVAKDESPLPTSSKKEKGAGCGSSNTRTKHHDTQDSGQNETEDGPDPKPANAKDKRIGAKRRKKRAKARKKQDARRKEPSMGAAYLKAWVSRNEGSGWRFNKANQIWLLKNCYDSEQIPKEDFGMLLQYLEGLQGAARERMVEEAKTIILLGGAPINAPAALESKPQKENKKKGKADVPVEGDGVADTQEVDESALKDRKLRLRRAKKISAVLGAELEAGDQQ